MKSTSWKGWTRWAARLLFPLGLSAGLGHAQGILFEDNFDTDTSASWSVFNGAESGPSDFTAQFSFDYSTVGIPPAPNSAGTTRGVRLAVNKQDNTADEAAVNLFPREKSFSGNYALRFDMWVAYNGGAYGGTGSTEFAIQGLNHAGDKVIWPFSPDSDGFFYAVTGEGGAAGDYRFYAGQAGNSPVRVTGFDAGFLDRDGNGVAEFEAVGTNPQAAPLRIIFPSPPFQTPEVPGKQWVQGELRQFNNRLTWNLNGYVIAELDNTTGFTSGNVMLGTMDIFSSIANPRQENFVIYDNVRVVNLDVLPPLPQVTVEATDAELSEPGTDTGAVTVRRTGATTQPLTVRFFFQSFTNTATAGVDFKTNYPALGTNLFTVTIPAGADSAVVPVEAIDDFFGEPDELIYLALAGNPGVYEVGGALRAMLTLKDNNDRVTVTLAAVDAQMYERDTEDAAVFRLTRLGDLSGDLSVSLQYGGTASGSDYDGASATVTIPSGESSVLFELRPRNDAAMEGEEQVEVTVAASANYAVGVPASATATIRDDDVPAGTTLFSDNFDTDSSGSWDVRFHADNGIEDYSAQFGFDYSALGVPPAPNSAGGTTKGLRVTVNKADPSDLGAAAVNLYAKGQNFRRNFAVRFDMYLTFEAVNSFTTEHAIFGINHTGAVTNRYLLPGSDGVWFAVETDGSASGGRSYVSFVGAEGAAPTFVARPAANLAGIFTSPPFQAAGAPSGRWVDVEVAQSNSVVTLTINGARIFSRTNLPYAAGTVMLGHMDTFNSIGTEGNYTLYDNLRVVDLGGATADTVSITAVDAQTYERDADDAAVFRIVRQGDVGPALPVALQYGGTASADDYEGAAATVTIPAGATSVLLELRPKNDAVVEGEEQVTVTVAPSAAYELGLTPTASATIRDDDRPSAPVVFSDAFETDTSAGWDVRFGAANGVVDYTAAFAFDYSTLGIPAAPGSAGGTTRGLFVTVNKNDATELGAAAVNLYPKGRSFLRNYALRFDMFLTFDPAAPGTTEHAIFGINHSGVLTNRHNVAGSDGLWFAVETDGSSSGGGRSYVSYLSTDPAAVPAFVARPAGDFAGIFTAPPFRAAGAASGRWVDVEVVQREGVVTLRINGADILSRTNAPFNAGTLMLGHMDTFNSIGAPGNFTIFDNVRVVDLGGALPTIGEIVAGNPEFSTLNTAVKAAGLEAALNTPGQFTLFAPNNAAFAKIPADQLAAILADTNTLTAILSYHVVAGRLDSGALAAGEYTTLNGAKVTVTRPAGQVKVNDATVVAADLAASNGVVHAIDTVLIPPPPAAKVVSIALADGKVVLTWTASGVLETAPTPAGPYTALPGATSGVSITPDGEQRYFRLQ